MLVSEFVLIKQNLSHDITKPTKWLCAQRRLRSAWASVQSDQSSLYAQWVAKDPSFLLADSEDSDKTGRTPRLIWIFAGRTTVLLILSCGGSNAIMICWIFLILTKLLVRTTLGLREKAKLFLLCVALCFFTTESWLPLFVHVFLVLLALRSPRLGNSELVCVLLVHFVCLFCTCWFCHFSLLRGWLRLVIVALPGLFY